MQAEQEESERELTSFLQQLADQAGGAELSEAPAWLATLYETVRVQLATLYETVRVQALRLRTCTLVLRPLGVPGPARVPAAARRVLSSQAATCRHEREALRSRQRELAGVHGSLRAYGPEQFGKESQALKREINTSGRQLRETLQQLSE